MAYLLAQPTLTVKRGTTAWETQRGRVLIMGGDQVYPTAKRTEYENRMVGPYRAALPWTPPGASPHLYLIPGNHDWYDGLTSFIRFFCQKQYVGGWLTRQERSYFAFRLPHGWWLWAIDIQFDTYIDSPQLRYFKQARELLGDGDRIILVTGKPSWTKGANTPSHENLEYFEKEMVAGTGASVTVWVSGDQHHYCRYEDPAGRQRITSGGGGAYLSPTHDLPDRLALDEVGGSVTYECRAAFPTRKQSKRLRWRAPVLLPIKNWRLSRVLAILYFLPAVLLQIPVRAGAASSARLSQIRNREAAESAAGHVSLGEAFDLWVDAATSRWLIYAGLVLFLPFFFFAAGRTFWTRLGVGTMHAAMHLALILTLVPLSAWILPFDWSKRGLLIALLAAVIAGVVGMVVLGVYLLAGDLLLGKRVDRFPNETFSSQGIKDYKNFLRLHLAGDGSLTIYPVGVDKVFRRKQLELRPDAQPGASWFAPTAGVEEPRLLEQQPIVIPAP